MSAAQDIGALGITPEERELAAEIAGAIQRKLPRSVQREDLQQAALIVLIEEKVLESRDVLIGILKEKQLLEKLAAQHIEDLRLADRRHEGNQLDEIAGQRFQRGASEGS